MEGGTGIIAYFHDITVASTWQSGGAELQRVFFQLVIKHLDML